MTTYNNHHGANVVVAQGISLCSRTILEWIDATDAESVWFHALGLAYKPKRVL